MKSSSYLATLRKESRKRVKPKRKYLLEKTLIGLLHDLTARNVIFESKGLYRLPASTTSQIARLCPEIFKYVTNIISSDYLACGRLIRDKHSLLLSVVERLFNNYIRLLHNVDIVTVKRELNLKGVKEAYVVLAISIIQEALEQNIISFSEGVIHHKR